MPFGRAVGLSLEVSHEELLNYEELVRENLTRKFFQLETFPTCLVDCPLSLELSILNIPSHFLCISSNPEDLEVSFQHEAVSSRVDRTWRLSDAKGASARKFHSPTPQTILF